jgi:hypothetical protein
MMSFLAKDKMKLPSNSLHEYMEKSSIALFDFAIFARIIDAFTSAWVINPESIFLSHWGQRTEFFASKIQIGSFI